MLGDGQRPPQHGRQHLLVCSALLGAAPHIPRPQRCMGCRGGGGAGCMEACACNVYTHARLQGHSYADRLGQGMASPAKPAPAAINPQKLRSFFRLPPPPPPPAAAAACCCFCLPGKRVALTLLVGTCLPANAFPGFGFLLPIWRSWRRARRCAAVGLPPLDPAGCQLLQEAPSLLLNTAALQLLPQAWRQETNRAVSQVAMNGFREGVGRPLMDPQTHPRAGELQELAKCKSSREFSWCFLPSPFSLKWASVGLGADTA